DLALDLGDPNAALAHAEDGLADLHHHPDPDLSWKLQWRRAQALRALHRDREALAAFVQAVSDADDLRKGSLGYRLDTTFVGDKLELFGAAIELACDRHDGTSAARIIELVKARALAATMSIPPEQRAGRGTVETEFDELSMRIDALSFQQYADRATKETVLERRALLARRRDVVERLRIADPRWRAMSEPVAFDVGRTLERLADGDRAALTLHHRDNKIVAVLLKDGRARVASTRLPDRVIEAVDAYTANLRRSRPDEFAFDLSTEGGVGWRDLVPAVLAEDALSAGTLLVVPHGRLHLLPWAGLETGDGRAFQRTAVGLLPNLTALTVLDAETTTGAVALIGDPDYRDLSRYQALPEAGAEIGEIAALYRSRRKPVRGRDATEAAFWALTERDGAERCVLHVVCHADLDATDPLTSGLILTRSRVDAGEIALRRIPCPEVVLSACSTAWRPDRAENLELTGDDALGLVASFLEAGARFVLASLPPVLDNAARAFATGWHRHRLAGASPLQAVRGVQEELIRRADLPVWSWIGITGYGCR
ncbi:MAG TPA: CHAT domain-containing protein, partial [Pseudonocardia sp.]|nr:CHAT domain-containing protein [Pseudonocardia sp.]